MTKQTTVRLPVDLAEEVEFIARIQDKSVNELIISALTVEIQNARKDKKFMDSMNFVIQRDRKILDRLAR